MDHVKLTNDVLSVDYVYNLVCAPDAGAVSIFVGTTRDNFEGKVVTNLQYEAYEGMAIKAMENICKNIRQNFDVKNIAIYHRLGNVPVQEASVIIAISSAHRKPSLDAVPYAIDALKADVTIWKKEMYEGDAAAEWKENPEWQEIPVENVQLVEEVTETKKSDTVPIDLIQINANSQEINRRVASFINRKRQQLNLTNVQDFCMHRGENEFSCARVDAVLMRRKDSKSHLKVHRVENSVGPQTHGFDPGSRISKLPTLNGMVSTFEVKGAEERLTNAEEFVGIKSPSLNVYERLKAIEEKLLYLESVSPEYFQVFKEDKQEVAPLKTSMLSKATYSAKDLSLKLEMFEAKFKFPES